MRNRGIGGVLPPQPKGTAMIRLARLARRLSGSRRRHEWSLAYLPDHLLRDIGVEPGEVRRLMLDRLALRAPD